MKSAAVWPRSLAERRRARCDPGGPRLRGVRLVISLRSLRRALGGQKPLYTAKLREQERCGTERQERE